jgi:hypothetical protein
MSAHVKACRYSRLGYREIGEGCCDPAAHAWWLFREYVRLRDALLVVSTDNAQDRIEDPVGHADRENAGFYRIGRGAMKAVRDALAAGSAAPTREDGR